MKTNNSNKYINTIFFITSVVLLVLLSLVSGFRILGEGPDYSNYVKLFTGTKTQQTFVEPGFAIFRSINNEIFFSSITTVYFIAAIISLFILFYSFTQVSKHYFLALLFYIPTFYLLHPYTQIRVAVAISIFFLSIKDIRNDDFKNYFFKILLAFMFHYSSIMMFFCWLYIKISKSVKFYVVIPIIGFVIAIVGRYIKVDAFEFITKIQLIFNINKSGNISDFMSVFNLKYLSMLILLLILSKILIFSNNHYLLVLFKIYSFGLCFYYYLNPLSLPVISVRFAEYYTTVIVLLLAEASFNNKVKQKSFFLCCSIFFILFYFYATIKTLGLLS